MTAGVASSPCRARSPLAMTATWSPRRSPQMEGLREDTLDHGSITLDMDGEQIIADDAEAVESK